MSISKYGIIIIIILISLPLNAQNIVINEIMQNPSFVSDSDGEWVEFYNNSDSTINLLNWGIRDAGIDNHIISESVLVNPDSYVVLGINGNTQSNGGVNIDYQYSSFSLSNSDDEIILYNAQGIIIDSVYYDGGISFPDPNGKSMALINHNYDNNDGANWVESNTLYNSTDYGTPGEDNFFISIQFDNDLVSFDSTSVGDTSIIDIEMLNIGNINITVDSLVFTNHQFISCQWALQNTPVVGTSKCTTRL